jgi:hypothetical protein
VALVDLLGVLRRGLYTYADGEFQEGKTITLKVDLIELGYAQCKGSTSCPVVFDAYGNLMRYYQMRIRVLTRKSQEIVGCGEELWVVHKERYERALGR